MTIVVAVIVITIFSLINSNNKNNNFMILELIRLSNKVRLWTHVSSAITNSTKKVIERVNDPYSSKTGPYKWNNMRYFNDLLFTLSVNMDSSSKIDIKETECKEVTWTESNGPYELLRTKQ